MKKILANFGGTILSRGEMKKVFGAATATASCGGGVSVSCSTDNGSCAASDRSRTDRGGCACFGPGGSSTKDCPIA